MEFIKNKPYSYSFAISLILIIATISFYACNKEQNNVKKQNDEFNEYFFAVKVVDNILVLESENAYNELLNHLAKIGDSNFEKWEKSVGFNSLRKQCVQSENMEMLDNNDELFLTLLNTKSEIIIGEYLFHFDFKKEIGYVYSSKELKSSNRETFMELGFDDDFFAIINGEESSGLKASYCGDDKDGYYYWTTIDGQVMYKVVYQKSLILNSLQAKIKKNHSGGVEDIYLSTTDTFGNVFWRNTNGCKNISGSDGGSDREYNLRLYNSSKRLIAYRWCIDFYVMQNGSTTHYTTLQLKCNESIICTN